MITWLQFRRRRRRRRRRWVLHSQMHFQSLIFFKALHSRYSYYELVFCFTESSATNWFCVRPLVTKVLFCWGLHRVLSAFCDWYIHVNIMFCQDRATFGHESKWMFIVIQRNLCLETCNFIANHWFCLYSWQSTRLKHIFYIPGNAGIGTRYAFPMFHFFSRFREPSECMSFVMPIARSYTSVNLLRGKW